MKPAPRIVLWRRYALASVGGAILTMCAACGGSSEQSSAATCPALPTAKAPAGTIGAQVDALVAAEMNAKGLPGMAVAIAKDGVVIYAQGYGYANLSSCAPVQADTEFQIGSVTKQFTAAAILKLHAAGTLNIETTAASYLPAYAFDSRVTIRMLLEQTAGLVNYTDFPEATGWLGGVTPNTVLTAIAQRPLAFTPGSAYQYSNSNYFVLGAIIEAVTGRTYENYMQADIATPIGLTRTAYQQPLTSAFPYTTGNRPGIIPHPSALFAAGALWSNVTDLAKWDVALRHGNVIPIVDFNTMITPPIGIPEFGRSTASIYAMGWVRQTLINRPFVWHNGETLAYTAFNGMFLDNGFTVSVLTNVDIHENSPLYPFARSLIQTICTTPSTATSC